MIHETSMLAYQEVKRNLSDRQRAIYTEILYTGPISIYEVAHNMHTLPNRISGRFSELKREYLITDKDVSGLKMRKKFDGGVHSLWRVTTEKERLDLIAKQKQGQTELF